MASADAARLAVDDAIRDLATMCQRCPLAHPEPATPHKAAMTAQDWADLQDLLFEGAFQTRRVPRVSALLASLFLAIHVDEREAYLDGLDLARAGAGEVVEMPGEAPPVAVFGRPVAGSGAAV